MHVIESNRKTMKMPPHAYVFEHKVLIYNTEQSYKETAPVKTFESSCITPFPELRCRCWMFDLEWSK